MSRETALHTPWWHGYEFLPSLHCLTNPFHPDNVLRDLLTRRRQGASAGHHTLWANSVCLEILAVRDCRTCFQCLALPHLLAGYLWSPSGSFLGASREEWGQLGCPAKCSLFCFPVFKPQSFLHISVYNFCHLWSLRYFSSPVSSLHLSSLSACFKNIF